MYRWGFSRLVPDAGRRLDVGPQPWRRGAGSLALACVHAFTTCMFAWTRAELMGRAENSSRSGICIPGPACGQGITYTFHMQHMHLKSCTIVCIHGHVATCLAALLEVAACGVFLLEPLGSSFASLPVRVGYSFPIYPYTPLL